MNICLRHMISYPPDGYCDQCAPPRRYFATGGNTPSAEPCTCPTMITMPDGQPIGYTCPRHGLAVFHEPMVT